MNQKYSKSQRDAIIEEHLKGAPVKQLAEKHGISKSTIDIFYNGFGKVDLPNEKA